MTPFPELNWSQCTWNSSVGI